MTARHDHSNPWADKLQDVRIPDVNDGWKAMEVLLDEEMPRRGGADRRRWVLLVLLLLLLTWICNCPGRGRFSTDRDIGATQSKGNTSAGRGTGATGGTGATREMGATGKTGTTGGIGATAGTGKIVGRGTTAGTGTTVGTDTILGTRAIAGTGTTVGTGTTGEPRLNDGDRENMDGNGGHAHSNGAQMRRRVTRVTRRTPGNTGKQGNIREEGNVTIKPRKQEDTLTGLRKEKDSASVVKKTVIPRRPAPRRTDDSTAVKDGKRSDTLPDVKGWVAGVGLNQFFTVGGQQRSDYNSSGTTGGLSDYIPVPMVRYYFSRRLFVQMEAQLNTPQYVKNDLLAGKSAVDNSTGVNSQSALYIKKLFYFNVPLSVHYSPLKNVYAGAGIQYSRLTNGVGLVQSKLLNVLGNDSTIVSSKIGSFKGDSIYRKMRTNEFRLLLDLDYNYKRFIVGVRYNQALSKFLNVRISNTEITQARNSSIQVYLRYMLWDGRKKKSFTK